MVRQRFFIIKDIGLPFPPSIFWYTGEIDYNNSINFHFKSLNIERLKCKRCEGWKHKKRLGEEQSRGREEELQRKRENRTKGVNRSYKNQVEDATEDLNKGDEGITPTKEEQMVFDATGLESVKHRHGDVIQIA